jgi:hypothetical protein
MHRQGSRGCDYQKRQETTWAAVGGYGYFAPGRVAMDEHRERVMIESAQWRLLPSAKAAGRWTSPWQRSRQFIGDLSHGIEARLRQVHACGAAITALRKSSTG